MTPTRSLSWSRLPSLSLVWVGAVVILGSAFSVGIYHYRKKVEQAYIEAEFERRTETRNALTREIVANYQSAVYTLKCLFEGSVVVTRGEFHKVTANILSRYPGITALEWIPVITAAERTSIERTVSEELGRPFQFTESDAAGAMMRAQPRDEYFPVVYVEPLAGNERALGYDLKTGPTKNFLEQARRGAQVVVSFQFPLVQSRSGVVMIWPVYRGDASEPTALRSRGFVQGVFRVDLMLAETMLRNPSTTEMLYLDDTAESPEQRLLYDPGAGGRSPLKHRATEAEFRSGLHREYAIEFGGRRWVALYRPTAEWLAEQRTHGAEEWLLAGLTITALLAVLLAAFVRRNAEIQQQVEERTSDLNESRRQLHSLLHALPGMAYRCVLETELTVVFASEGALALTGYEAADFISQRVHFRDLIHPADLEAARTATRRSLNALADVEVEYRITTKNGTQKWVLSRGKGAAANDGRVWFEGLAIDVTAQKNAEEQKLAIERKLLESQKLESIGLLAGGIAHDFNNLLAGILGNANLARIKLSSDSPILDHLRKIEAGTSRAAELCQQMLAYAGRGQQLVAPIDLSQLVSETLPLIQSSFSPHTRIHPVLSTEAPTVMGDTTQLRQIVMNLVINAADALGRVGGDIFVTTGRRWIDAGFLSTARAAQDAVPGDYVFLEVRDSGCGMTRETLSKIFDPFFTTKFSGRGLGLAAVLGIVRAHSGALRVESELGRGSTFTLVLPYTNRPVASAGANSSTPWQCAGKVLVIDDEGPVRDVAAELIRSFGMDVVTATDGTDGIEKFRETPASFDLVLLDLSMPGLDGGETLAELRAIRPDVRVLLASGYGSSDRIAALAAGGPVLFLQKPFTRGQLERKVREIIS